MGCYIAFLNAMTKTTFLISRLLLGLLPFSIVEAHSASQPNVVVVITDDQGYGDLGCTGNPVLKTPKIDELANESVWLDDFHVAPTCSPTRCSLLTGHWTNRTGVWHTIMGRSMLRENETTVADLLKAGGYATGMFGKWHLGDNFPYRPHDRGFETAYYHGGGGIGQTPDYWDNDYFSDHYFRNGKAEAAEGFCTDVFFNEGSAFIKKQVEAKKPFFAYISLNAPHVPLICPDKYMEPYADQKPDIKAFFGMIANIDENVGMLRGLIKELGVEENTIFIFMTDNGTATGHSVYNAGMKGKKNSQYDGGHRVPFFMHWPAAKMTEKKVITELTHMVDFVPTLLDYCQVSKPEELKFDGVSWRPLIEKDHAGAKDELWKTRCVISDTQRLRDPEKWKDCSVMSDKWRLVNRLELYNITSDPGQENDISKDHPEVVKRLQDFYEAWWSEIEPTFSQTTEIYLGSPECPEVVLTAHDWIQEIYPPWNQTGVRNAEKGRRKAKKGDELQFKGHWAVKVVEAGEYEFELRRYPREANLALKAATPAMPVMPGTSPNYSAVNGVALDFTKAVMAIDGKELGEKEITDKDMAITFSSHLEKGSHQLHPRFDLKDGGQLGVFYVYVKKK